MAHRSRLCAAYVDVPREHFDDAVRFYSQLLGCEPTRDDGDPDYVAFATPAAAVAPMLQAVGDPEPRVHLDIETDDVEAEVARLSGLGATVVARIRTWVVMHDPVGNPFCVIRVQDRESFEAHARTWD